MKEFKPGKSCRKCSDDFAVISVRLNKLLSVELDAVAAENRKYRK